ncbi:MAG: hypothetical protein A2Z04_07085 [Chloroflexi bacterium RBG_16_57_9]|nr:MAG: hypothetical protein A2Z04_07085 [Chloroflexi bacterium RBG_16_57_9]
MKAKFLTYAGRAALAVCIAFFLNLSRAHGAEVQKVGTTSMQTLRIAASVRAIGMGETFCAVADDIQSIFWNPAGLIHINGGEALFSQINMPADIRFNTLALAKNYGRKGVLGLHYIGLSTDDMPVRTIYYPEGTGENFMAYDAIVGASYAGRLTDRFVFGANLRFVQSSLADVKYQGMLADFGTLYETNLRSLKLGMAVQNFGPDVDYDGQYRDYIDQGRRNRFDPQLNDYKSAPPPTIYRLGLSANFFDMTGLVRPAQVDGILALEISHPNDNRERVNLGMEFSFMDMLALRAGYKLRYKNIIGYDEERWAAGFGLKVPIPGAVEFVLDYAYMDFGRIAEAADGFMEQPHRFSVALRF